MFRFLIVSVFAFLVFGCSADSESKSDWFKTNNIPTSYTLDSLEFEVSSHMEFGFDSSAFLPNNFIALGENDYLKHSLYFDIFSNKFDSLRLYTDSSFYAENYKDEFPVNKPVTVKFYWASAAKKAVADSTFLSLNYEFKDSAEVSFDLNIRAANDSIKIELPEAFVSEFGSGDSLRFVLKMDLSGGGILRLAPLTRRVAQKITLREDCKTCLYSGIADSLLISFPADSIRSRIKYKTVLFAQIMQTVESKAGNEFAHPLPVYVYYHSTKSENYILENYIIDTSSVHSNLLFGTNDTLKLQASRAFTLLASDSLYRDSLKFVFRLGYPVLTPKSDYFYNDSDKGIKTFADRPYYSRYDFKEIFSEKKPAIIKVWFAD